MTTEPPGAVPLPAGVDRRTFLRRAARGGGAVGLALAAPTLLAACSSSGGDDDTTVLTLSGDVTGRDLVALFPYRGDYAVTGIEQRLPFVLSSVSGGAVVDDVPASITVTLAHEDDPPGEPIVLDRHDDGSPLPYFALVATFDRPGTWSATTEVDGVPTSQPFLVQVRGEVPLVQPTEAMVAVDTPTTADSRGVDPICTADPPCPFHEVTVTDALTEGRPLALLVGSPAYCTVGASCGSMLDLLVEAAAARPGMRFVHAETYVDPASSADPAAAGVAPVVTAYGLTFEPSLFVADATGRVVARLDEIVDRPELTAALDAAEA